jgi:hypothetical protein
MLSDADQDPLRIVAACASVIVIVVIGAAVVMWLRKRMRNSDTSLDPGGAGFTLGDLRQLHKSGKMTDEEFAKARDKVVAAAQKAAARVEQPPEAPKKRRPPGTFIP